MMKRILSKYFSYKWAALISFLAFLLFSEILSGQTTILSEGFESGVPPTGWTIIDNNSDSYKWSQSSTYHSGSYSMYYAYNSSSAANDWAITKSLSLTAGVTYTISFWYEVGLSSYPESMKLTVGNAATVAAQSTVLWTGASLTSTTWTQVTTTYTPSTSGTYYFGFDCYSAADMYNLYVDDILITSPASCTTPGAPTSVTGTSTGTTSANLSWAAGSPAGSATVTYYWVVGTSSSVTYGSGVAQGTTTGTSATTSALSCGTTYYLRVYANTSCDGTSSAYTTSSSFTTSACEMIVPSSGSNSYTVCSGNLYDIGGSGGNYSNSCNGYTVITPSTGGMMASVSGSITCEGGYDYLTIYDGSGTGGTVLWGGSAHGSGTACSTFTVPTVTSTTGPLTVKFYSDASNACAGFNLAISCTSTSCTTPGAPTSVTGTSTGTTSANLSWAAGSPAGSATVTYYWVVGTSSSVTYGSGVAQGTTTSTSATTTALSCGTTYYLRVYAYTSCDGTSSSYTTSSSFTTSACCTTPGAPTSVTGTSTGQTSANLSWAAGSPAGSATVTYYWVVGTSSSVTYGSGVAQGTTTGTSATTSALSCGTTYYLRVYANTSCNGTSSSYTTSSSFTTSACSGGPCASVTSMTAGTTYTGTLATTGSDWSSYTDCSYTESGDEVVYSFTPGSSGNYTFTATETSGDPDFYLMSSCGNTGTNITGSCWDSGNRTVSLTGGITYYLIVENYSSSSSAGYSVVVNSVAAGPSNDDCAGAITLAVGASCSFSSYTNANATATSGVPAPGCANYLGGDVWFKATVPGTGHIILDMDDNVMTDAGMAIYTGTCGSLSLVECDDDDSNNGLMSMIDRSGLTAGSTIYIRIWEYGNDNNGSFYICAYDPGMGACGSVTNIASCGTSTTVTSGGGSGNWNNQECGSGTPGVEKIFSFTPSTTAAYYLVITSALSYMTYAYQAGTCQSTGWTCMARPNAAGTYGPFNWTAGVTYYILVDDEDASSSTHTFYIKCPETPGTYYHPTEGLQGTYLGSCMVNTCTGTYTDDGGAANYSLNINSIYRTFCPDATGKCVRATFNSMDIEENGTSCYDYLIVRNGPTQGSSILWAGCKTLASTNSLLGTFSNPFTASTTSGCLTFQFYSDNTTTRPGWNISLSCVTCAASPTNNDCASATPICGATNVNSASPGPGITSTCGGCNLSENYSNWYYFEITNSGRLYLDIKPEDFFEDYDMALYQASNCASLGNPVRCTYAMTPQYCQPTSTGTSYYISRVRFNTIDNTSTYYSDFYANYTTSVSSTVTAGSSYNLQVTVVGATMYVVAWFDWNKNLQFDSGEFYSLGSGGNTTLSSSITIPGTARPGKTAFRVYTTRTSAMASTDACVSSTNGEIEDYAIYISDGTHCSNGVKDADEIGVDCGGTGCVPCDASYWPTNTGMNSTSTDYSEDVTGDSWIQGIPVNAGESYYLMVNNWSPGANGFDLVWNFTEGGAMDCSIVVPVELLDFEAKLFGQFTTLYWETASETNNDYFTVMKSTDAIIYKPIGSIDGAGNSNSVHTYTFDDIEPISQTTYYRLKQTDFDGKTTYSEVKVVSPDAATQSTVQQFNVFNDVNEENLNITLIGYPNAKLDYAIVDVMGRIIKQGKINIDENALGGLKLSTNDIAAGIYNIVISDGRYTAKKKFVIVK